MFDDFEVTYNIPLPKYLDADENLSDAYVKLSINFDGRPCFAFKSFATRAYLCITKEELENISKIIDKTIAHLNKKEINCKR
jgi:hypothetical protein